MMGRTGRATTAALGILLVGSLLAVFYAFTAEGPGGEDRATEADPVTVVAREGGGTPPESDGTESTTGDRPTDATVALPGKGPRIGATVARAQRDVTPDGITPAPVVTGDLVRIEGVKPSILKAPPPPRAVTLQPVQVLDAGRLRNKTTVVEIADVNALSLNAVCITGPEESWPCGRHARTALRRLIRGRAIKCERTDGERFEGDRVTAHCTIIKRDIGGWLVEQGWATPTDDGDTQLQARLADAKSANRGQWRDRSLAASLPATLEATTAEPSLDLPSAEGVLSDDALRSILNAQGVPQPETSAEPAPLSASGRTSAQSLAPGASGPAAPPR